MKKMMETAKGLNKFFKVLQKIVWIAVTVVLCVLAVLTAVSLIDGNALIGEVNATVDFGALSFEMMQMPAYSNAQMLWYAWGCAAVMLLFALITHRGLKVLRKILAPMEQGNPFDPQIAHEIKKLANLTLVFGILQNIVNGVEATLLRYSDAVAQLMESGLIRSVSVNYTLDCGFIVVYLILLLISYIFAYGAKLQQLSDETV